MSEDFPEKSYKTELFIMKRAVMKSASSIVRDFGELERLQVSRKGVCNFITSADTRSEDRIITELKKSGFDYNILSEERGFIKSEKKNCEYTWVVDPIDGTNNFRRGIPYFCSTIALTKNDEPVASVCLDPVRNSLFKSAINLGAYADGRNRIRVTSRTNLPESVIAIHSNSEKTYNTLTSASCIVRRTGSVAMDLSYLSAGKYDAVIIDNVQWWDIASGIIMIKESGGFVEYSKTGDAYKLRGACTRRLLNIIEEL